MSDERMTLEEANKIQYRDIDVEELNRQVGPIWQTIESWKDRWPSSELMRGMITI